MFVVDAQMNAEYSSSSFFDLGYSLPMSTTEAKEDKATEGKKAGPDAPPVNIGWDSHEAVVRDSKYLNSLAE